MNLDRLYAILKDSTHQLRKGPEVSTEQHGPLHVTHVYLMPDQSEAPPELEKVDCHFIVVGVDKGKAEQHKAELHAILKTYPQPDRLAKGVSYIEVGAEIGDQGAALCLFALGQVCGFWKVITPAVMGVTGPQADRLAGAGLVLFSGFTG